MNAPTTPRAQLIAEERAAERAVIEAESRWLFAQAGDDAAELAAATERLAETRLASQHVRQRMQDGLAAWTRYAAYREAVSHAAANGLPMLTGG
jgi:hypothetical protein